MINFEPFPKMARFSRDVIVTEKIDGTNAQVIIVDPAVEGWPSPAPLQLGEHIVDHEGKPYIIAAASRTRMISPGKDTDNYGFAAWVFENRQELVKLGPGRHFGEWWGKGIQRNYSLNERRFSLFNVSRWMDSRDEVLVHVGLAEGQSVAPSCCHVVPVIYSGKFDEANINGAMTALGTLGSYAARGFKPPEGIVIFHTAARVCFKKTFENDTEGKGLPDTGKEAA